MPDGNIAELDEDRFRRTVKKFLDMNKNVIFSEIVHGPQEFGKDIVFKVSILGHDAEMHGIQVKAVQIHTNKSKNDDGYAGDIIKQLKEGFTVPYRDSSGNEWHIKRMYLITNKTVTETAKKLIGEGLGKNSPIVLWSCEEFKGLYQKALREKEEREKGILDSELMKKIKIKKEVEG